MSFETDAAGRYRAHAKELRAIAEADDVTDTREKLLTVAIGFERMAQRFENLAANSFAGAAPGIPVRQPQR